MRLNVKLEFYFADTNEVSTSAIWGCRGRRNPNCLGAIFESHGRCPFLEEAQRHSIPDGLKISCFLHDNVFITIEKLYKMYIFYNFLLLCYYILERIRILYNIYIYITRDS